MSKTEITISGVGPYAKRFTLYVSDDGGVYLFEGPNGGGKTKLIDAISRLVTGKGGVSISDTAERAVARWGAAMLTVAKRATVSGELEVLGLDGLNVSEFVDPGLKDPLAADSARIRKLIQLAGATLRVEDFHGLLGGPEEFSRIVPLETDEVHDPVYLAAAVKRHIEAAARTLESRAEIAFGHAEVQKPLYADLELDDDSDEVALREGWDEARAAKVRLEERAKAAIYTTLQIKQATLSLETENRTYLGQTAAECDAAEKVSQFALETARHKVRDLEVELRSANEQFDISRTAHQSAVHALQTATRHEKTVAEWKKQIDVRVDVPTPAELAEAAALVEFSKHLYDHGALIRRGIEAKKAHDQQADLAIECGKQAARLREAAAGTEDVLTRLVANIGLPFSVRHGRLCYATDRDQHELVADLSHGERVKLGIDIVVNSIPKGSTLQPCLILDGPHWGSLQPSAQAAVAAHVKAARCILFSEVPTDAESVSASEFMPTLSEPAE